MIFFKSLNSDEFHKAISKVNTTGFSSIDLSKEISPELGEELYKAMDKVDFHPARNTYYNEIAFFWPEDWADIQEGLCAFHEEKSLKYISSASTAKKIMIQHFGNTTTEAIFSFAEQIKNLTISNHHRLKNNELRLARVMIRQMNENQVTRYGGSEYHEDRGYSDRPYQQLLSVIITTHGIPTVAEHHEAKVGELLIFNAYDRSKLLDLKDNLAFIHSGPKSGPKLFFFFEFLGPRI